MGNRVSVLIPCYNGEAFIDRCLRSVAEQNYPEMEIVVVNDGSKDRSEEKILLWKTSFEKEGRKFTYICKKNEGVGAAVNTGLKYISGAYLSLIDADDEYLPGAIAERVSYLDMHPDEDVVRSNGWYVRKSGQVLFINNEEEKSVENIFEALLAGTTNNWAGSYMVRTSALFRFYPDREIYGSRYGQNLQLLLPLTYRKKCGFIDKPHMNYIQREDSLSQVSDRAIAKEKDLENTRGYYDIRLHMLSEIVKDQKKLANYRKMVRILYLKSIMHTCVVYQDKTMFKDAYDEKKQYVRPSIDEKIIYYNFYNKNIAFFFKIIRKIRYFALKIKGGN